MYDCFNSHHDSAILCYNIKFYYYYYAFVAAIKFDVYNNYYGLVCKKNYIHDNYIQAWRMRRHVFQTRLHACKYYYNY